MNIRGQITHPTLIDAFDSDWYYPFELTADQRREKCVKRAIEEGWPEWIESPLDLEAIRHGYVFDLSRDTSGRTIYWHNGGWVRYSGSGKSRRLTKIPLEDEHKFVAHIGAGDHFCRFAEAFLFHTKDPLVGRPYRFLPYQRKAAQTIFGWVRHAKDPSGNNVRYRRYQDAMIEVAKKNAKSDFGSVVAVYLVRADHSYKAYVYGCAADKKQASIIYKEASDYITHSPYLKEEVHPVDSQKRFLHMESASVYQVISSDAESNDGPDAHGVLFDELHRQKTRKFFTVMKRAGRARPNKFRLVTTTYGDSLKNIWGEEHLKAKAVLNGSSKNWRKFVLIASAEPITVVVTEDVPAGSTRIPVWRLEQPVDVGEVIDFEPSKTNEVGTASVVTVKLTAPAKRFQPFIEVEPIESDLSAYSEGTANKEWRTDHAIKRANPAVGTIFGAEEIWNDVNDSVGPEAEAEVKRLSFNIIAGSGRKLISGAAWSANAKHKIVPSSLLKQRCFGGLDMSFKNDLTAFALAFPSWPHSTKFAKVKVPLVRVLGWVWVPEETIEEREKQEEVPYRAYSQIPYFAGKPCVRLCRGETIDYEQVGREVCEIASYFKLQVLGYDPAYSCFVIDPYLVPGGIKCVPHRQGSLSMGPPTKRFEELVKKRCIAHGSNPILDNAIEGHELSRPDKAGNQHPEKGKSTSRIDLLVATIMAVGWACDPPVEMKGSGAWSGAPGSGAFA